MKTYLMKQKRLTTLLLTLLVVLSMTVSGFTWNVKTVTILADGQTYTIKTHLNSTDGILHDAGVPKGSKDAVLLSTKTLQDGSVLTVLRAFPVQVTVDGHTKTVMTVQRTATGLAAELGYVAPNYVTLGNATDVLQANSTVAIAHITSRSVKDATRPIEVETVRERNDQMARGEEVQVQAGSPGVEQVQEEVLYENGKEVKKQVIATKVITPMVPTIIQVGTRENVVPSRGDMRYSRVLTMEASAYLPSDGGGDGITASGISATRGIVAVDPNVIPLGTRLYIPGYGEALAADTGGAIQGARIDLVMESYGEAMSFGRREVEVYVLQ